MYNKINVQRRLEKRECPCCGKQWELYVQKPKNIYWRFCDECNSKLTNWQKKTFRMQKDIQYKETYQKQRREEFLRNYVNNMLHKAKARAEKKGLEYNIEESDIIIPKMCPILEVPLIIGTRDNYEYSPSIDRIDNSKGYIKGNVQIVSKKANSMKNSATKEELKKFCANVLRYSLNITENECNDFKDKEP